MLLSRFGGTYVTSVLSPSAPVGLIFLSSINLFVNGVIAA
jgi:hypothetical protein